MRVVVRKRKMMRVTRIQKRGPVTVGVRMVWDTAGMLGTSGMWTRTMEASIVLIGCGFAWSMGYQDGNGPGVDGAVWL